MQQYRLRLERVDAEGSRLVSEYETGGHRVLFAGELFPKDLEFFSRLVSLVKYFHRHGRIEDNEPE